MAVSKLTPTLQVVVNPPLRRGSPIHDRAYRELHALGADYVRYVPWLPYPRLGVAELEPPANGKTSWDFSLIHPITIDFLNATQGHSPMLNFSTIPAWMFRTPKPVTYPQDPNQILWNYTQGTELRDPSGKELADYYARLVSWYVAGGFTDEYGKRHNSGHHFEIPYWEVLNEVDFEHNMTPQQYTNRYDAIVAAIHKVSPETKFVGLALAAPTQNPAMFEYFLDPRHHRPGTPLDMISYHFYASPEADETPDIQEHTFWAQADGFLHTVNFIEAIRRRLSPQTKTTVNEIGCISADDGEQGKPGHVTAPIPESYWHLCGANYAYVAAHLAAMGIDIAGESQLVGYPTQYPSVSLLDWNTGEPNARFRALELLKRELHPGDRLVKTATGSSRVFAMAFISGDGLRRVLLINKRNEPESVTLPERPASMRFIDVSTANRIESSAPASGEIMLGPYSVAVARFAPASK